MTPFKVLTYNVHRGRSAIRKRDVCEAVARILDFSSADVVCLQEVWQAEGFDQHGLEPYLCAGRWPHRLFTKTAHFKQGIQGNAVVSRLSFLHSEEFDLSMPAKERRGVLRATVQLKEGVNLQILNVHLGLGRQERLLQAKLIEGFIECLDASSPLILLGDFNDWNRELSGVFAGRLGLREAMVTQSGRHAATYPAIFPVLPLDRIYFRNLTLVKARVVREQACLRLSDHLPVEAEFFV